MASQDRGGRSIASVEQAVALIDEIQSRQGAAVTELAGALDMSKSSVHHYLTALRRGDLVEKSGSEYDLGVRFLKYGGYVRHGIDVFEHGKHRIDELARETGETACIVVPDGHQEVTIYTSSGEKAVDPPVSLGMEAALPETASGRAMLAVMSREQRARVSDRAGSRGDGGSEDGTVSDLDSIRSRGYELDDGEQFDGRYVVGTWITTRRGDLMGAISLSAPVDRVDRETVRTDWSRRLKNAAGEVEINARYADWG